MQKLACLSVVYFDMGEGERLFSKIRRKFFRPIKESDFAI